MNDNSQVRSATDGCPEKAAPVALEPDEAPTARAELQIILLPDDFSLRAGCPVKQSRRRKRSWRRSGKK